MANIPVNFGGVVLSSGQSITGSFAGLTSFGTAATTIQAMEGSEITFKYGVGLNGSSQVIESAPINTFVYPGTTLPLYITSCSVNSGASVILYT